MNEDERNMILKRSDSGESILGILDILEQYDIKISHSSAITLLMKGISIQELLTKEGKSLPGVPASVRRAVLILQSVMSDGEILEHCRMKTLYHLLLPKTWMTLTDLNLLKNAKVKYSDLEGMTLPMFEKVLDGDRRPDAYHRIMNAYREFEGRKKMDAISMVATTVEVKEEDSLPITEVRRKITRKGLERTFRETVYDRLEDTFSLEDAKKETGEGAAELLELLEELCHADLIVRTEDGQYKKRIRTLRAILSSMGPEAGLLRDRLEEGLTLQEISKKHGIEAREVQIRLRQSHNKIPVTHVKEARRYLQRFERFDIPEYVFMKVFDEPASIHRFLSVRVQPGTEDIKGLYGRLNERQRQAFLKYLSLIVTRDGEVMQVTRANVFEHVLWSHADEAARTMEEWKVVYDQYVEETYKIGMAVRLKAEARKLATIATQSESVIPSSGKRFRYYDRSRLTQRRLQRLRGLLRIEPGFYGTNHLFRLEPSLMEELDCQDPDELQYVIRRYVEAANIAVVKQSEIVIGLMDKAEWLKKLIRQHAPIGMKDFQSLVEERFGLSGASVRQSIRRDLPDYLSPDGTLGQSMSLLTKKEATWFSRRLTKEIYTYEELEEAFPHIEQFSSRYLNAGALEKVGFINQGGLVLRAAHGNAESYFESILSREELFTIPDSPVYKSSSFKRIVKRMEDKHDLFRFDASTYISIARLRKVGVNKGMIKTLIKQMLEIVKRSGEDYFTFSSIQTDLDSPIVELGMEDIFFEELIRTQKRVGSIRTARGDLFYIGRDKRRIGRFLLDLLPESGGIDIDMMREEILKKFRLNLDRTTIITNIRGKGGYFSTDTEMLYKHKEGFLDSIFES